MKPPDQRLKTYYAAECDCGWIVDGYSRPPVERKLDEHHATCNATKRLERTVTFVWKAPPRV